MTENIWQELGEKKWQRFVREVNDEPKVFTLEDQTFLEACGISAAFPWWDCTKDRGSPLRADEKHMRTIEIGQNATVLVVEDNPKRLEWFTKHLPGSYCVDTSRLAIDFLKQTTPDLIFLDFHLHHFHSIEAARYLAATKFTGAIYIHSAHRSGAYILKGILPQAHEAEFGSFIIRSTQMNVQSS